MKKTQQIITAVWAILDYCSRPSTLKYITGEGVFLFSSGIYVLIISMTLLLDVRIFHHIPFGFGGRNCACNAININE